jgi:hypothetical protein
MDNESSIVWSVLFGGIGVGYFVYGRKQRKLVPFISGIALMGVPYFIDGTGAMVAVCVAFMALPLFVQL